MRIDIGLGIFPSHRFSPPIDDHHETRSTITTEERSLAIHIRFHILSHERGGVKVQIII